MKRIRSALPLALMAALGAALVVLAVLQYHWIEQVSDADRKRMQQNLNTSVAQFVHEFRRELQRPCMAFRPEPGPTPPDPQRLAELYVSWVRSAPDPQLVSAVYLFDLSRPKPALLQMDSGGGAPREVSWPAGLDAIREDLGGSPGPPRARRPWIIYEQIPAFTHTLIQFSAPATPASPPSARLTGVVILELNSTYVRQELLPELVRKHFGTGTYDVAVIDSAQVLYDSGGGPAQRADARVKMFGPLPETLAEPPREGERRPRPEFRFVAMPAGGDGRWEMLVRHRQGSLDAVVNRFRVRNLAVSFGTLLMLAAAMTLIIASTHRAQRLAKLQMDFVAGVSHEFRTPVAVIHTAADNLAEGVVDANPRVKEYGALIRDQGRRLREMVEQILSFAAGQGNRRYELRRVNVEAVIDGTLADCRALAEESAAGIDKRIEPGLPPAVADEGALKQCLRNLVTNALKYGGDKRWVGIVARKRGAEIEIAVEDHGLGIDPGDLPHVFEPFYRGQAAVSAQIHGTGLGLSLAKGIVEGMGGRIVVDSTPGAGSSFRVYLKPAGRNGDE